MKLVNEKGKLFGVINLVDLVVILAIIAVAAGVLFKFAAPAASNAIAPKSDVYVTMRIRGAMNYLSAELEKLEAGERLVAGSDYVEDAELVSVEFLPYYAAANTSDGKFITSEDSQKKDVILTVKSKMSKSDPILKIGTQEVRIGRGFIFKTQTVEVNTIIETVEFDG